MAEADRSIAIPIRGSEEIVEVFVDDLPDDPTNEEGGLSLIDVLRAEIAPLNIWLEFAIEYYRQGRVKQFKANLNEASFPGTVPFVFLFGSLALGHFARIFLNDALL